MLDIFSEDVALRVKNIALSRRQDYWGRYRWTRMIELSFSSEGDEGTTEAVGLPQLEALPTLRFLLLAVTGRFAPAAELGLARVRRIQMTRMYLLYVMTYHMDLRFLKANPG